MKPWNGVNRWIVPFLVLVWGCSEDPYPGPVPGRVLDSNRDAVCFLDTEGRARCWGYDGTSDLGVPAGHVFSLIGVAQRGACGLEPDGEILCWGQFGARDIVAPEGRYQFLDMGEEFGCALDALGAIHCWGDLEGQVVPSGGGYRSLTCGSGVSCAIDADERLVCWGSAASEYSVSGKVRKAAVRFYHVCVIREDGTLECQAQDPRLDSGISDTPGGRFIDLDVHLAHACAIDLDGELVCWGTEEAGRTRPPAGGGYTALSLGRFFGCAMHESGRLDCWGQYRFPVDRRYEKVAATQDRMCLVTREGSLECLNTGEGLASAWDLPDGTDFVELALGSDHGCALKSSGSIACFGDDTVGQIAAPEGTGWIAVEAGGATSCALAGSGGWVCWGDVSLVPEDTSELVSIGLAATAVCWVDAAGTAGCAGQFVDDDEMGLMEAAAPEGQDFVSIEVSDWNACALSGSGGVFCAGFRQGDGSTDSPPGMEFSSLTLAGEDSDSYALSTDGRVIRLWGWDDWALSGRFVSIAAAHSQLCGVDEDGFLVCSSPWVFDPR